MKFWLEQESLSKGCDQDAWGVGRRGDVGTNYKFQEYCRGKGEMKKRGTYKKTEKGTTKGSSMYGKMKRKATTATRRGRRKKKSKKRAYLVTHCGISKGNATQTELKEEGDYINGWERF